MHLRGGPETDIGWADRPVDDLSEPWVAIEVTNLASVDRGVRVELKGDRDQLPDLPDVLLGRPAAGGVVDLRRAVPRVERVRGDADLQPAVSGDAEVTEEKSSVLVEEDVRRCEVPVDCSALVKMRQSSQQAAIHGHDLRHRQRAVQGTQVVVEVAARSEVHDRCVDDAAVLVGPRQGERIVDVDDGLGGREDLGEVELSHPSGLVVGDLGRVLGVGIVGEVTSVHGAEATGTERLIDAVRLAEVRAPK